jgi:D-glutamate cyclase
MSDGLLDKIRDAIQQDVNQRGLVGDLFNACRDDFAAACRSIAETPQPALAIVTGFFIPHAQPPCGETDGPLGAIFLARALTSLGISVSLLTDTFCLQPLKIGLDACGLQSRVLVNTLPPFTYSWDVFLDLVWQQFRNRMSLTHLMALERAGPGFNARCHNMHGRDVTEEMAPAHLLFEHTARQTLPLHTIGIGDGGNEIGMGKIAADVIARNVRHGERIACRVSTDYLIVAGVSNWGAYALAAGVAVLRRQRLPASLFDVEQERELLRIMVEQGPLVDGVTARPTVSVDGLPFEKYAEPLQRIGAILESEQWLTYEPPPAPR